MVALLACVFFLGAAGVAMADVPEAVFELDGNSVVDGMAL